MFSFSRRAAPPSSSVEVKALYRRILRAIRNLEPEHQKTYYDYTRLKIMENEHVKGKTEIRKLIEDANEELAWVESVLRRKAESRKTPRLER